MNSKRHGALVLAACLAVASGGATGPDGADPEVLAIRGARLVPVASPDVPSGIILVKDGVIADIGPDVVIPDGAQVVEAAGLTAYPGMIDCSCQLGLSEISGLPQTVDFRESGRLNPQVRAWEALRPESMHIPIARSNGITAALAVPSGGLIAGQSGLIRLTGRVPGEMLIKGPAAMHVELPSMGRPQFERRQEAPAEPPRHFQELEILFGRARSYDLRKRAAAGNPGLAPPEFDETLEFLGPVVRGELPLWFSAHSDRDIQDVIRFVKKEKIRGVLYAVTQGWKCVDEIAASGLPVVFSSLTNMPASWEDGYDALYRTPGLLHRAGVKIAFSSQSASAAKDLPWMAAKAAAFGLDKREALRAVTINAAEILGVAGRMGSLEKGKAADIVLADGDLLELRTNVVKVYIDGKEVSLRTVYDELLEKHRPAARGEEKKSPGRAGR